MAVWSRSACERQQLRKEPGEETKKIYDTFLSQALNSTGCLGRGEDPFPLYLGHMPLITQIFDVTFTTIVKQKSWKRDLWKCLHTDAAPDSTSDKGRQILLHCIQARCQSLMRLGNRQREEVWRKLQNQTVGWSSGFKSRLSWPLVLKCDTLMELMYEHKYGGNTVSLRIQWHEGVLMENSIREVWKRCTDCDYIVKFRCQKIYTVDLSQVHLNIWNENVGIT